MKWGRIQLKEIKKIANCSDDPAALEHLFRRGTLLRVRAHHLLEKLLELLCSKAFKLLHLFHLNMRLPKLIIFLVDDHFVQFVLLRCQFKRQVANHQCEQDDSEGKDISFVCLIWAIFTLVAVVYFWCHVSLSSTLILQKSKPLILQQKLTSKAKVTNFHTNLSLSFSFFLFRENQHILQLQIPMGDAVAVKIINSIDNISKDVFFLVEGEVLMFLDVAEEGAMLSVFHHHDVLRVELFILCITQRHPLLIPKRPHDVLVLHLAKKTELVSKMSLLATVRRRHRFQHHA